jgi:hypothetical protein
VILAGQFAKRTRPLVIAGPEGVRERIERTFEALYPGATQTQRAFDTSFVEFSEHRTLIDKRPQLACERIVITHMSEEMLARVDDIDLQAATDGAVTTL